ncbi:RNA polymerase III RPC4-domain-containing protein [Coniella lustricola]|uniref:RNA polymerase III RPC4-domain-containing protein n=1 Tax=Coniella lustricola TaxID=2025994 RepID=A0A2T3A1P5_9PEZI|nr:RNA polymerase III RPC4-domain-containing protein [Coniella lustricola]
MAGEDAARDSARGGPRGRGAPRGRARGQRGRRGGAVPASSSDVQMADGPNAQPVAATQESAQESSTAQPTTTPIPITSTPLASRAATPTRGVSARGGAAAGRFLPRAIRRSQLDRETIAAQETAKQETKAAADARLQRAVRGGRGGGRRARGGPPTGFDRVIRGGAGGFGSTIQASTNRAAPSAFGSLYDAPSAGGSRSGGSGGGGGSGVKNEHGVFNRDTESSRPTGRRMNTDKIAEFASVEDDEPRASTNANKSKESTPTTSLLPKGMYREELVESEQPAIATTEEVEAAERGEAVATVVVVPSAEGSDEDGDLFNDDDNDVEMKDDGRKWPGAKNAPQIKIEGEEITEIDKLAQRRAEKKREAKEAKKKLKFVDEEDRLDAEKLAYQRKLFGVASDADSEGDNDEDETKEKAVKAQEERKPLISEGSIYLWQFPPVMPPLHKVERAAKKGLVKDEPTDDVVMLNAPAHSSSTPVDLTAADEVKQEDEDVNRAELEEEPSGFVGKLIIRKSGKMQIDWGGMLFDCETGIAVSHYREAVLTEEDDDKQPDGFHGTAYGMGAIAGKFNAVPHWSDVEPWVVNDSQLPPWGIDAAPDGTVMET